MATKLEKAVEDGEDFDKAVQKLLTEIITEHGAWCSTVTATRRSGRSRRPSAACRTCKTTLDACRSWSSRKRSSSSRSTGCSTQREMHSRYEVRLGAVRADHRASRPSSTLEIGSTIILPAAIRYQTELAQNVAALKAAGVEPSTLALEAVSAPIADLEAALATLEGRAVRPLGASRRSTRPSTPRTTCCRRWTRSAPPPTRWKALWPTTCGRCRPIRRCCTSSELKDHAALYSGRGVCALVESAADGVRRKSRWTSVDGIPLSRRAICDKGRAVHPCPHGGTTRTAGTG